MNIINSIIKAFEDDKEREIFLANQQRQNAALKRREAQYWLLALVFFEAIEEDKSSLGVEPPSIPKLLEPTNTTPNTPQNWNEFSFVLKRGKTNVSGSDSVVLPHEVSTILETYFKVCGFSNFKILCSEDSNYYYVTIRCLMGFCFGHVLATNVGELIFIQQNVPCGESGMRNRNWIYGKYDIKFYNGGTYNGIIPRKPFEIYEYGFWYQTSIVPDENNNPKLTHFNAHPDYYVGCIARIKKD